MSGSAAYVKLLVQARRDHADALVEGAQAELPFSNSNANLVARHYNGSVADVITVINLDSVTGSGTVLPSPLLQDGTYCDVVSDTNHVVSGNRFTISVPAISPDGAARCVHNNNTHPVCGLRVLVQGSCSSR